MSEEVEKQELDLEEAKAAIEKERMERVARVGEEIEEILRKNNCQLEVNARLVPVDGNTYTIQSQIDIVAR